MAPLALVAKLTIRWRHLHKLQIWPQDGATSNGHLLCINSITCITCMTCITCITIILIDSGWFWLILIGADWCWLMLIGVEWCWFILYEAMLCYKVLSYQHWPMSGAPKQPNEALQTTFQSTKSIRGRSRHVWLTYSRKSKILGFWLAEWKCLKGNFSRTSFEQHQGQTNIKMDQHIPN